jgi:hypothetical protein
LIVGISVKQKHRPTVENRATKKSAQAAYTFLTRLMRGARNIEGKAEAAKNILRFCSGERTPLACWRKRPAFANFEIQKFVSASRRNQVAVAAAPHANPLATFSPITNVTPNVRVARN